MSQPGRGKENGPEFLLTPPVLSAKNADEKISFDDFDGVHAGQDTESLALEEHQIDTFTENTSLNEVNSTSNNAEIYPDNQQVNLHGFSSLHEPNNEWSSSHDGVHRVTSNDDIHRVTSEAKLYHPKPQRLVSAKLAESSDVLNGRTTVDEPITTELDHSPMDDIKSADQYDSDDSGSILESPQTEFGPQENFRLQPSEEHREPSLQNDIPADDEQSICTPSHDVQSEQESLSPREYVKAGPLPAEARPFDESFQRRQSAVSLQFMNDERLAYYPAPVPVKLLLPPLLSKKRTSKPTADFVDPQRMSSRVSVGLTGGVRRRSSQILAPPMWFINAEDAKRASMYGISRSPSPALSIDSGRATLEDEDDYQDLGDDVDTEITKKKKKNKKANKNDPDYMGSDVDEEENEERLKQMQQHDTIAFSHYDPSALNHTQLLAEGGGVLPTKKMSLIEELEFRKAKKKNQRRLVLQEKAMAEANGNPNLHPLDARNRPTLLELQHVHNAEYEEDNHLRILQRHKQLEERQPDQDTPENGQSLKELRRKLKQEKKQQELEANETLAQRRRRLKTAKPVDIAA